MPKIRNRAKGRTTRSSRDLFHSPAFRLILRALVIWLGVFCLYALINKRISFLNLWTAAVFARLLDLLGMDAQASQDLVTWHDHAQAFRIIEECTGIFGFWILSAFMLATPTRLSWRLIGVVGGGLIIFVANQLRLLGLALVQTYWPTMFQIAHDYLWQVVFVMVIAATFLAWLGRIDREVRPVSH
jgi:archaeosortase B (VPXXXP-CTERM-specific)